MNKPKIVNHEFPDTQYYKEETKKVQAYLHHTVSGQNVTGDIDWWKKTPARIATCVIIDRKGTIHTLFSSEYWAHHLGVKKWMFDKFNISSYGSNQKLNKQSVGIELDSWGGLIKRNGKFYRTGDKEIDFKHVFDYGTDYRGFRYFEKYTEQQIESTKYVLKHWNKKYNIPLDYYENMWDFNEDALKGKSGIWSHTSVRPDKSDCYPDSDLIKMLKNLKNA